VVSKSIDVAAEVEVETYADDEWSPPPPVDAVCRVNVDQSPSCIEDAIEDDVEQSSPHAESHESRFGVVSRHR
jgi:hypothetical protein